ncbi:MAG: DUF2000 family protein [Burkholderiales bacterium]|nr:DUF2000 family protein [Burkholderiales bacterium]
MAYLNTHKKTVLVLNTEFSSPLLFNAAGHALLGLISKCDLGNWNLLNYPSPGFGIESKISEYPVVVLRVKRSAQLEKLVQQLDEASVPYNAFLDAMIGQTAEQQQQATFNAHPNSSRIMCVALFEIEDIIRPIIKSFSVYKESDSTHLNNTLVPQL